MLKTTLLVSMPMIFAASQAFAGIKGTVSLQGKAPAAKPVDMSSDPKCKKLSPNAKSDDTLVKDGKVQNVFVYVKNPPKGKYKPKGAVVLDQKGCTYSPKVFGIMEKQKLEIINSDPTLHNVHAFAKRGEFNQAMPLQGQKLTKKFKKEQVMVPIKCDVHGWMAAYAGVLEHPYFSVTDQGGKFDITGDGKLPDGEYDVAIWHETLGEQTAKVKVSGGKGGLDFTYKK